MLDDATGRRLIETELWLLGTSLGSFYLSEVLFDSGQLAEDGMFFGVDAIDSQRSL